MPISDSAASHHRFQTKFQAMPITRPATLVPAIFPFVKLSLTSSMKSNQDCPEGSANAQFGGLAIRWTNSGSINHQRGVGIGAVRNARAGW
jgi:hypothetical protein